MRKFYFGFLLAIVFAGCYPEGPTYVSDLDLVLTNHVDTFDFEEQQTYFLFDTVVQIGEDDALIPVKHNDQIIDRIEENMNARGYVRLENINEVEEADLLIAATAWTATTVGYIYDWGGYWGWGWPGYGWGYPGYGWGYTYSYTFGTVMMEMSYPAGANVEEQYIPVVWHGIVNGLIDGSDASVRQRIDETIDQAFEQSEYILSNPE